ncbi:MAG: hypothetical protein JW891_00330 [Candidatus Lokiarchaeota archaeon]|nr:hypothetical protein [Candidatus Lokiarchaeota archaeon]
MGDVGTCQTRKTTINTHENSGDNIEDRALRLIKKYQIDQSPGSTSSAS